MKDLFVTFFSETKAHKSVPLKFDCQPATCFPVGWVSTNKKSTKMLVPQIVYTFPRNGLFLLFIFKRILTYVRVPRARAYMIGKFRKKKNVFQNYANKHKK